MADGLLSGVLPAVYSRANALRRLLGDVASDPMGNLRQRVGYMNDMAGGFNELTGESTKEAVGSMKQGGGMFPNAPATNKLTQLLAESYAPIGMQVWHGSPHKFDKFDASKIGTGEGAQAYGHGLYLAEAPEVAKSYMGAGGYLSNSPHKLAADTVSSMGGTDKALKHLAHILPPKGETTFSGQSRELIEEAIASIKSGGYQSSGANLYKVDLPDSAVAKMLDWDKPLQKQVPQVQQAIKARLKELGYSPNAGGLRAYHIEHGGFADATGDTLARKFFGDTPEQGAEFMKSQGIPGIRYLDQASRGTGQGTSNFVVFPGNEGLLSILERNGQPLNKLSEFVK